MKSTLGLFNDLVRWVKHKGEPGHIDYHHVEHCQRARHSVPTILFPPRMKMVTALVFLHSSITNMRSAVVPKEISFTTPAVPSFSGVNSENLGTIRPPVAMAINCSENRFHFNTDRKIHLQMFLSSVPLGHEVNRN